MPAITAQRANPYTGSRLDRVAHRRDDAEWVEAACRSAEALWIPLWKGRHLVSAGRSAVLLSARDAAALRLPAQASAPDATPDTMSPWALLGLLDGRPLLTVDISAMEDPLTILVAQGGVAGEWDFAELRAVVALLPADQAALLAHARGLMHWRARHRFCGVCGGAVTPRSAGQILHCGSCGTQHFPRTDPAVIMLVLRGDCALLAHSERFPTPTMYSTLAGFVEPGESLEEAVAREVFEEAGVRVRSVTYHSSQPWPFPASLMIGFHAETQDERIVIDGDELTDARWFTRADIRDAAAHGFMIPGPDSIARRLIEDWLDHS